MRRGVLRDLEQQRDQQVTGWLVHLQAAGLGHLARQKYRRLKVGPRTPASHFHVCVGFCLSFRLLCFASTLSSVAPRSCSVFVVLFSFL